MAGKVFISCGQRDSERGCAQEIARILEHEFGLVPYLAFQTQSLDDIMTITDELRSSDYYVFVDFLRESNSPTDLSCSLFTHQELALAHHLGFGEMIALQQKGAALEGFVKYVLSNPAAFSSRDELYSELRRLVGERKWSKSYSRNLVVEPWDTWQGNYGDHSGAHMMKVWSVKVRNMRPDVAAVGAVCILDCIENTAGSQTVRNDSPDRSYLKWSGQIGYERTILPEDFGVVNVLSVHEDEPGAFLLSSRDAYPRSPILNTPGEYRLHFKIFSEGFPLLRFVVPVSLDTSRFALPRPVPWAMQLEKFGPPTVGK